MYGRHGLCDGVPLARVLVVFVLCNIGDLCCMFSAPARTRPQLGRGSVPKCPLSRWAGVGLLQVFSQMTPTGRPRLSPSVRLRGPAPPRQRWPRQG
jgi:hypothetical protein